MKIYTLNNDLIDRIVDDYIDYVTNPYSFYRQSSSWQNASIADENLQSEARALTYDNSIETEMKHGRDVIPSVLNLPKPNRLITREHFVSLIHQLYLRYISKESGEFIFSTQILQKVFRNYNYMLDVLCHKSIIQKWSESVGEFARNVYHLAEENEKLFKFVECKNKTVIDDINKIKIEFNKLHKIEIENAEKLTSKKFIKDYNKSLKSFFILNNNGLNEFIESYNYKTNRAKLYYKNIVEKIRNKEFKEIDKADDNGRIYHIITKIPKKLRIYTNIKHIMDSKNSHPLLFNYMILEYIFNKKNINIKNNNYINNNNLLYYYISLFIFNNNNNTNISEMTNCTLSA